MSNGFESESKVEPVRIRGLDGQNVGGNFYEMVGGKDTFKRLADVFYQGVADDEILRPMYPEGSLEPAAERLQLFLEQYWAAQPPIRNFAVTRG